MGLFSKKKEVKSDILKRKRTIEQLKRVGNVLELNNQSKTPVDKSFEYQLGSTIKDGVVGLFSNEEANLYTDKKITDSLSVNLKEADDEKQELSAIGDTIIGIKMYEHQMINGSSLESFRTHVTTLKNIFDTYEATMTEIEKKEAYFRESFAQMDEESFSEEQQQTYENVVNQLSKEIKVAKDTQHFLYINHFKKACTDFIATYKDYFTTGLDLISKTEHILHAHSESESTFELSKEMGALNPDFKSFKAQVQSLKGHSRSSSVDSTHHRSNSHIRTNSNPLQGGQRDLESPKTFKIKNVFHSSKNPEFVLSKTRLFKMDLTDVMDRPHEDGDIPMYIDSCIKYLYSTGLDYEGIFRVPGPKKVISSFVEAANSGTLEPPFDSLDSSTGPHAVAGVVKQFFRDIPGSLLTKTLSPLFIQCAALYPESSSKRLNMLQQLLARLPRIHARCYKALFDLLLKITTIPAAKMNANNLAIVFTMNLFDDIGMGNLDDARLITTELIENHEKFLPLLTTNAVISMDTPLEFVADESPATPQEDVSQQKPHLPPKLPPKIPPKNSSTLPASSTSYASNSPNSTAPPSPQLPKKKLPPKPPAKLPPKKKAEPPPNDQSINL